MTITMMARSQRVRQSVIGRSSEMGSDDDDDEYKLVWPSGLWEIGKGNEMMR